MRRWLAFLTITCILLESVAGAAVRGRAAKYVGGTVAGLTAGTDGFLELADSSAVFRAKKGAAVSIPYGRIESLEYGQKVGRRVGAALGTAMAISPVFLLLLFSKKRKHFLTIGFTDESGSKQGAVFELAKGVVHETLTSLETTSGKKVEFESEEAQKYAAKR